MYLNRNIILILFSSYNGKEVLLNIVVVLLLLRYKNSTHQYDYDLLYLYIFFPGSGNYAFYPILLKTRIVISYFLLPRGDLPSIFPCNASMSSSSFLLLSTGTIFSVLHFWSISLFVFFSVYGICHIRLSVYISNEFIGMMLSLFNVHVSEAYFTINIM